MNYLTEARRNALAAEYVLGTLRGKARVRYQKLMMQYQVIAETTALWEQYLDGLNHRLPPVTPPPRVWEAIQKYINPEERTDASGNIVAFERKRRKQWRLFSGVAAAAALMMAVLLVSMTEPVTAPVERVAIFNDSDNQPLWIIEISGDSLNVRVTGALAARTDKDYQLWMAPAGVGAPVSLGLLPKSGDITRIPPSMLLDKNVTVLAVSMEPPGGSPNGSPTDVLYHTNIFSV
ncbi:MAG: hypothetical protein CL587_07690 [Alteromonadaceae bacterium]|nr:hypothetical protein [Alteromonadaceae bacterium]